MATAGCGRAAPAVAPASRPAVSPAPLRQSIDALIAAPQFERGTWGIAVRSLATGETLYARNARTLLMPASAMKLVTLAAAAERLGWDFTYQTRVVAAGRIADGVLHGDLVIVGTGDPSIDDWDGAATRLFGGWAEDLKARGIRTITGRIVGDDNRFSDEGTGSGWAWDDLDRSYATAAGALQFNQNTARLHVFPGATPGRPAVLLVSPDGSGLVLRNGVVTADPGAPSILVTRRGAGSRVLEARGSVAAGGGGLLRNVSVPNATLYFVTRLREVLLAHGIAIGGPAMDIDDIERVIGPPDASAGTELLVYHSPPLATLAVTMMKVSQNLYAETLLNTIGGPGGDTTEAGRMVVRDMLARLGAGQADALVADGSGLSRYNLIAADTLVAVLAHVNGEPRLREPFTATLPVAGVDGTLALRFQGTAAEGHVRAKTGTFSNARALAGYATTAAGEPLAFAIIANNFGVAPDAVDRTIDAVVLSLLADGR